MGLLLTGLADRLTGMGIEEHPPGVLGAPADRGFGMGHFCLMIYASTGALIFIAAVSSRAVTYFAHWFRHQLFPPPPSSPPPALPAPPAVLYDEGRFSSLPDDVLKKILDLADEKSVRRLACVCKSFRVLVKELNPPNVDDELPELQIGMEDLD